jgi:hypothetical protein
MLHAVYLLTIPLLGFSLVTFEHFPKRSISPAVLIGISLCVCWDIGIAFFFRATKLAPASEALRTNPNDPAALMRWRAQSTVSFCFAETVVLMGFVVKFLGAGWSIVGIFFAVGTVLMLLWAPRLDVPAQ